MFMNWLIERVRFSGGRVASLRQRMQLWDERAPLVVMDQENDRAPEIGVQQLRHGDQETGRKIGTRHGISVTNFPYALAFFSRPRARR